jgi:uncharacterized protein YdeI (YjbR/CyaY-like superfamily)
VSARLSDLPLLEPADRAAWSAWLEANHQTSPGVWLAVGKKGNTRTALTYEDAVEEAVRFGWIDSTTHRLDADRFRQLFTPRKPGSTWSQSNKARVERLEARGLMTPAGRAAVEVAKSNGSWTMLDEIDSLTVPEDLAVALAAAPPAERFFAALSSSQQKMILYWIASAKLPETRARRITETVQAAEQNRIPR